MEADRQRIGVSTKNMGNRRGHKYEERAGVRKTQSELSFGCDSQIDGVQTQHQNIFQGH